MAQPLPVDDYEPPLLMKPELSDEELEERLFANTELWARIQRDLADPKCLRPLAVIGILA